MLLGRKPMTNLDCILKSRDITLLTKVHLVKAVVFPVIRYRCESWTRKKAECQRIDAFELWCWRRLLRVPWTARRPNQSILKEIIPEYSLEGLMLKLQFFGHLMQRTDSSEKILMLTKIERSRRGRQGMRWLDDITNSMDMSLSKLQGVGDGQGSLVRCSPWGRKESDTTEWLNWYSFSPFLPFLFFYQHPGVNSFTQTFISPCYQLLLRSFPTPSPSIGMSPSPTLDPDLSGFPRSSRYKRTWFTCNISRYWGSVSTEVATAFKDTKSCFSYLYCDMYHSTAMIKYICAFFFKSKKKNITNPLLVKDLNVTTNSETTSLSLASTFLSPPPGGATILTSW